MDRAKPFDIPKREVWEAYKKVRANQGAAGVDGQSIYRPGKSALDAVGAARQRCWRYAWVVDLDIKAFFDSIDTDLLMRAVRKHRDCPWALLYIERWLKAPVQTAEGSLIERERGTPQGGVVSPLLANLFLHYAFDKWMQRNHPGIPFERYADDGVPRTH